MNDRDETDSLVPGSASAAPAPAFNKSTVGGCAGILLVLSLPALLFLPIERWHLPLWLGNLIPLCAVTAAAGGAYLLMQVPPGAQARSRDPRHPLTSSGKSPIREQPAGRGNRIMVLVESALVAVAGAGYGIVSFSGQLRTRVVGTIAIAVAGYSLLALGYLATQRRIPMPAWRWIRVPVQGRVLSQALPMIGLGLVLFTWSLMLGAVNEWVLLPIGMILLGGSILSLYWRRLWQRRPESSATR